MTLKTLHKQLEALNKKLSNVQTKINETVDLQNAIDEKITDLNIENIYDGRKIKSLENKSHKALDKEAELLEKEEDLQKQIKNKKQQIYRLEKKELAA